MTVLINTNLCINVLFLFSVSTSVNSIADEHVDTSDCFYFDWQSASDEGSFDSGVAWIPSFEDDEDSGHRCECDDFLGFSDLPDIDQLDPEQMSMCLQKTYPHDEHW